MFDSQSLPVPGPITLSPSNLLLVLTLAAISLRGLFARDGHRDLALAQIDKPSLLAGGGLLVAAFFTLFVAQFPDIVLRIMVTLVGGLLVLLLTQALVTRTAELEALLKVYTWGATICAAFGIIQGLLARFAGVQYGRLMWALGGGPAPIIGLDIPRVAATWNDPNSFGVFLAPAVALALGLPIRGRVKGLLTGGLLSGIALSYSRTAWISTAVAIATVAGT